MERGYVKLWRKSIDSPIFKNHELFCFWSYCLMKASHKKYKVLVGLQMVELDPGQFVFGRKKASIETGLSERKIRTCLKKLENFGNLTSKTTNKFSIVSIINWGTYQTETEVNDQQSDQQVTNNRPTSDQQVTTYKNNKHIKNMENKEPPLPPKPKKENPEFDKFWEMYGKKVDRKKCLSKFNKLKQSDIDSIFAKLPAYVESTPDPQYRKNPYSYLHNESWNDQIIPKGKLNGKAKNYTGKDTREPVIADRMPEY